PEQLVRVHERLQSLNINAVGIGECLDQCPVLWRTLIQELINGVRRLDVVLHAVLEVTNDQCCCGIDCDVQLLEQCRLETRGGPEVENSCLRSKRFSPIRSVQ